MIPGLIHDYGYRYNYLWRVYRLRGVIISSHRMGLSDGQAYFDRVFLDTSLNTNGLKVVSYLSWFMLKIFGRFAWRSNRLKDSKELFPGQ